MANEQVQSQDWFTENAPTAPAAPAAVPAGAEAAPAPAPVKASSGDWFEDNSPMKPGTAPTAQEVQQSQQTQIQPTLPSPEVQMAMRKPTTATEAVLESFFGKHTFLGHALGVSNLFSEDASKFVNAGSPLEAMMQKIHPGFKGALPRMTLADAQNAATAIQNGSEMDAARQVWGATSEPIANVSQQIEKEKNPFLKAAAEQAESMMSPRMVAIMEGMGGLPSLFKTIPSRLLVSKLIAAGFGINGIVPFYQHSKEFAQAVEEHNYPEAVYQLTHAIGTGLLSGLALKAGAEGAVPVKEGAKETVQAAKEKVGATPEAAAAREQAVATKVRDEQFDTFRKAAPSTRGTSYEREDFDRAIPEIEKRSAAMHEKSEEATTVKGFVEAANRTVNDLTAQASSRIPKSALAMYFNPLDDIREELDKNPKTTFADEGMKVLDQFKTVQKIKAGQPVTLGELDSLRSDLNKLNDQAMSKIQSYDRTKMRVDSPEFAAQELLNDAIKDYVYNDPRVPDEVRNLRRTVDSTIKLREAAERQIESGGKTVAGTGKASLGKKVVAGVAGAAAAAGTEAVASPVLTPIGAGPAAAAVGGSTYLGVSKALGAEPLTRDQLIERMKLHEPPKGSAPSTGGANQGVQPNRTLMTYERQSALKEPYTVEVTDQDGTVHNEKIEDFSIKRAIKAAQKQFPEARAWRLESFGERAPSTEYKVPALPHMSLRHDPAPTARSEQDVIHHELGHAMIGQKEGIPSNGMLRHTHPDLSTRDSRAAVSWIANDLYHAGRIRPDKIGSVVRLYMGGIAEDELRGTPRAANHNFDPTRKGSDGNQAFMALTRDLGVPATRAMEILHQAIDTNKEYLTHPAVDGVIKENAPFRERGLSSQYHFSAERLNNMHAEVQRRMQHAEEGTIDDRATHGGNIPQPAGNVSGGEGRSSAYTGERVSSKEVLTKPHWSEQAEQAVKRGEGFSFHPFTGEAPTDGYMVEAAPERRETLPHPATAEDIQEFTKRNTDVLAQNPSLFVGGYKNELNISAKVPTREAAVRLANALDQEAVYDVDKQDLIETDGKGQQRMFPNYPFNERLTDAGLLSSTPVSDKLKELYGTSEPRQMGFILSDGSFTDHGALEHDAAIQNATRRLSTPAPRREQFINDEKAIRYRYLQTRAGNQLTISVPRSGVNEAQARAIEQAVGRMRNGNLYIERNYGPGETANDALTAHKEFARVSDVRPMLEQVKAAPMVLQVEPPFQTNEKTLPPRISSGNEEWDKAIEAGGGIPGGLQKLDEEDHALGLKDFVNFHDPKTGSTHSVYVDNVTPEAVRTALEKSRKQYGLQTAEVKSPAEQAAEDVFRREMFESLSKPVPQGVGPLGAGRSFYETEPGQKKLITPEVLAPEREEVPFGQDIETEQPRVSTRVPTAKNATEDALKGEPLTIGMDQVRDNPRVADKFADKFSEYSGGGRIPKNIKDAGKILDRHIDRLANNLKWLWNQVAPEQRERTRKWYQSANRLASDLAEKNNLSLPQASAIIATQSPQTEWFTNVSRAERITDIYRNKQDFVMDQPMLETAARILKTPVEQIGEEPDEGRVPLLAELLSDINGKKLSELKDPVEKAAWIRLYDETHNDRSFHEIDPATGEKRRIVTGKGGTPSKASWGTLGQIANAVSIIEDGSRANISEKLGAAHKVRNFYNNIVDPSNDRDVTIDTHAVAAAHLRPFSGNDRAVLDNFGAGGKHNATGVYGTYPVYAEAYRRAAKEVGVLPREMQSVVWEHIREMFPDTFKTPETKEAIDKMWQKYDNGDVSLEETQNAIAEYARSKRPANQSMLEFLLGKGVK